MARKPSGLTLILIATAVAGAAGYGIQILVPAAVGPDAFVVFAAFWSALYLVISALSGVQQEFTRATRPGLSVEAQGDGSAPAQVHRHVARTFAALAAGMVFIVVTATGYLWVPLVIPGRSFALAIPLAFGAASYVLVATLCGTLYGIKRFAALAWLTSVDSVLRLIAISISLLLGADIIGLAWAIAVPFPLTIVLVWGFIRRGLVGASRVDSGLRTLGWNSLRTVIAGAATGVLISGFPFLVTVTSVGSDKVQLATLVLAVTLTRAPLIIPMLALQSYLVVRFRDAGTRFWRELVAVVLGVAALAAALGVVAWLIGPWVLDVVFGGKYVVGGATLGILVASAGLTGALCVSGPAVLALGRHLNFTAGWVAAAAVTVAVLLLPLALEPKALLALSLGPAAGFLVHVVALSRIRRAAHRSVD